jgi:hypothetical protein
MVACDQCNWWIHASCDGNFHHTLCYFSFFFFFCDLVLTHTDMDQETYNRLSADPSASYVCPKCRSGNPPPFKMNEGARRKVLCCLRSFCASLTPIAVLGPGRTVRGRVRSGKGAVRAEGPPEHRCSARSLHRTRTTRQQSLDYCVYVL